MSEIGPAQTEEDLVRLRALETLRRDGNPLALYDLTQSLMASGRTAPRIRYLQVLALAQMGDIERAAHLYENYRLGALADDEDALALRGRIFKDRARTLSGAARALEFNRACQAYRRAYRLYGGYFPGINAASTAWAAGDTSNAQSLAQSVLGHEQLNPPRDFFSAASRAEALVLLGQIGAAADTLERWLSDHDIGYGERASAYRQLNWLCSLVEGDASEQARLLRALQPPPVLTFTGHMFRSGTEAETALAGRICDAFDRLGSTIAYGALACGADILIAEEILRRNGEIHVVLPFVSEDFVEVSVRPGGEEWVGRYEACMARAASVTLATRMNFMHHDSQFSYGAQLAMGLARLRAAQISAPSLQMAIWDGATSQSRAGAALDVDHWRSLGQETLVIDSGAVDRRLVRPEHIEDQAGPKRVVRAIIFTDFEGYSRLPESEVPTFNREIMGRIAAVLNRHKDSVCSRNTWGDALYAVIVEPMEAAEIALEITEALENVRLGGESTPQSGGMRIGLHFGPVYEEIDPVTGLDNFYGAEVTLTARIEPKGAPGAIYATQAFAAMLAATWPDRFSTRYIGRVELAKGYGEAPIYQVIRPSAQD